jgi:hypothetical protein
VLKDRILQQLSVLSKAAMSVKSASNDGAAGHGIFGHLHIVFRDWSFSETSRDSLLADLLADEPLSSADVDIRNAARQTLRKSFASIEVWMLPPPVANTCGLSEKIRFDDLSEQFVERVNEMKVCVFSCCVVLCVCCDVPCFYCVISCLCCVISCFFICVMVCRECPSPLLTRYHGSMLCPHFYRL